MRLPRMLEPLKIRDFALLWSGMTVSRIGDRFFTVAMAWETYSLSNKPIALGLVAACSTAPFVLFVVFGGVLSDRFERRRMMIASDVIRAASIGAVGALALTRVLGSLLFGVPAADVVAFGGAALLLAVAAVAASWVPARRAAGLDPAVALRAE